MNLHTVLSALASLSARDAVGPSSPSSPLQLPTIPASSRALRARHASVFAFVLKHASLFNEAAAQRLALPADRSLFAAPVCPQLGLGEYIERFFLYTRWGTEVFVTALVLMDRAASGMDASVTSKNVRRLWASAVLVAGKLLDDNCYTNTYLAKVACVRPEELAGLELALLARTSFGVLVAPEDHARYAGLVAQLERAAATAGDGGLKEHFRRVVADDAFVEGLLDTLCIAMIEAQCAKTRHGMEPLTSSMLVEA
eukprot:m51a1_g8912 hypothetical protein (255) ;mRNA; f:779680-780698